MKDFFSIQSLLEETINGTLSTMISFVWIVLLDRLSSSLCVESTLLKDKVSTSTNWIPIIAVAVSIQLALPLLAILIQASTVNCAFRKVSKEIHAMKVFGYLQAKPAQIDSLLLFTHLKRLKLCLFGITLQPLIIVALSILFLLIEFIFTHGFK
ncbi:hypothetical protein Ciccas_000856 [Cichlidogyrus casuarinus]|uniref:Uncharacterized protein n=1 Tax=Cichlidogyrus casuarinus TaxID=1844966 RepID=A0ABD2QM17_9PLAT